MAVVSPGGGERGELEVVGPLGGEGGGGKKLWVPREGKEEMKV